LAHKAVVTTHVIVSGAWNVWEGYRVFLMVEIVALLMGGAVAVLIVIVVAVRARSIKPR
jgi:hypothetical protein